MIVQVVCGVYKVFLELYVWQPNGVHDNKQFKYFILYKHLQNHEII
jgi:hypothetical protein